MSDLALRIARKSKRRADGGSVDNAPAANLPTSAYYDTANKELKLNQQEQALYQRHLTNLNGSGGVDNPDGSRSSLYQSVQEHNGRFYNVPTVWDGAIETEPYTNAQGQKFDVPNRTALQNVYKAGWDSFPSYATPEEADARYELMHGYMDQDTRDYMAKRQHRKAGGPVSAALDVARRIKRAKGGKVHIGPVIGDTGGRADKVKTSVPNGTYVIPAQAVSHLGENNTMAGLKILQKMFPLSSPKDAPRSRGGTVPVAIADGEFCVSPADVSRIGGGNLDHGHRVLDKWVMQLKEDHIKTLRGLEPPVKD